MNISCVITDDEPLARRGIENYVNQVPFLILEGVCEDAITLNSLLQQKKIDLVFLDIQMPYLTGIELLKSVKSFPRVILTTAYENYALEGFELDVLDYLLKPISFDRFLKAANKAADYFAAKSTSASTYIFVKTEGRLEKIQVNDIFCVEALENYVAIHTKEKKWIAHLTLKAIQDQLPACFLQTHKSWIVNSDQISAVDNNTVWVNSRAIPLSKQHRDTFMLKVVDRNLLRRG